MQVVRATQRSPHSLFAGETPDRVFAQSVRPGRRAAGAPRTDPREARIGNGRRTAAGARLIGYVGATWSERWVRAWRIPLLFKELSPLAHSGGIAALGRPGAREARNEEKDALIDDGSDGAKRVVKTLGRVRGTTGSVRAMSGAPSWADCPLWLAASTMGSSVFGP